MTRPGPFADLALMGHTTHRAVVVTPSETYPGLLHVRRGDDWIGDFGPSAVFGITPHSCRPDDFASMRCVCGEQLNPVATHTPTGPKRTLDEAAEGDPFFRTPEEQMEDEMALAQINAWRAKANTHTSGALSPWVSRGRDVTIALWRPVERLSPYAEVEWILRCQDGSQTTGRIPRDAIDCAAVVRGLAEQEWPALLSERVPQSEELQPDPVWDHEQGDDIPF